LDSEREFSVPRLVCQEIRTGVWLGKTKCSCNVGIGFERRVVTQNKRAGRKVLEALLMRAVAYEPRGEVDQPCATLAGTKTPNRKLTA
jgi:hypothetical protein